MSDNNETQNTHEENMEKYLAEFESIKPGQIIKGEIVKISGDDIFVNVGYKSEGILSGSEFKEKPEVGQTVEVLVQRLEDRSGLVKLSKHKADNKREWEEVIKAHEEKMSIDFKITEAVKGGFRAAYGSVSAFMPVSQIGIHADEKAVIGQTLPCKIIELNRKSKNIVVSNRQHVQGERRELMEKVFGSLKEGDLVKGTVTRITEFGAFIDVGGIEGLLHRTDMAYSRVKKITDVCNINDEIEVMIIKLDMKSQKISFGLKQKRKDPWTDIDALYKEEDVVEGKVKNITDFGAFLELQDGVEGLVHVSDFSWTAQIKTPSDVVNVGEIVKAKILSIDKENKKISLGVKQLVPNPWEIIDTNYSEGKTVKGKVKSIVPYGCFVTLPDGIEGLVHISDMSWFKKIKHPSEIVKEGEEIDIMVLGIDKEKKKISLGIKQTKDDPWADVEKKFTVGAVVDAKVTGIIKGSVFAELIKGVEGRILISELSWTQKINHPSEVVSVGDSIKVKVTAVDTENRKIELSLKQVEADPWEAMESKYKPGSVVEGKVKNIASFGVFVELEEGVEGLIHISDLSWDRNVKNAGDIAKEGDQVKVKVLGVEREKRRISLGLKQVSADPLEKYAANTIVEGRILEILDMGIVVEIEEHITGFVHISQLSEERVNDISSLFNVGDAVQVKIVDVDREKRKLRLSIKQANFDSEIEKYMPEADTKDTIGDKFGDILKGFIKD